jgi:uncharacterized protein
MAGAKLAADKLPYGFRRAFHVMAKPIGSACNLNCTYCYYLHKDRLLGHDGPARMPDDLLELFIRKYIESQDIDMVRFSWHGGEPTLLGLGFFQNVVRLQQQYANGKTIINDIQTNGTLLDDSWGEFFRQHRFVIGLSIDGPQATHDAYRPDTAGKPTFERAVRACEILKRYRIQFNTLTVIHRWNAGQPEEIYNFLTRELDSRRLQFLPCVEHKDYCSVAPQPWDPRRLPVVGSPAARPGNPDSVVTEWSVDPEDWGRFLCRVFDLWAARDAGIVQVNWIESIIGQLKGLPALMCVLADVCGRAVAVERDGSVFPCDHYVYPEHEIGNIREQDLAGMLYSGAQRRFGCNKRDTLPAFCRACEHWPLCNGECPKNRLIKTPDGQPGLNYLCPGWKRFFAHATPRLRELANRLEYKAP